MAALGGPERSLSLIEEMAGDLERIEAGSNGVCTRSDDHHDDRKSL